VLSRGFGRRKRTTDFRADTKDVEEVAGHDQQAHRGEAAGCAHIHPGGPEAERIGEDAARPQVAVVRVRKLIRVARFDANHSIRIHHRRLVPIDGADAHEQDGVESDAETERAPADNHEPWTAPQTANAMTNVLPQAIQPRGDPDRARVLTSQQRVPHRAACRASRVRLRQAIVAQFLLGHRAMELQFFFELVGGASPAKPVPKTTPQGAHRSTHASSTR